MKRFTYIGFLLFSLLAGSCIQEDMAECTLKIKVLFAYLGDGRTDIFADKHEQVNLYAYNEANVLVQKRTLTKTELDVLQGAWLDLLPGNYRVVCWGNTLDKTRLQDCEVGSVFEKAQITHYPINPTTMAMTEAVQPIDSLYYGETLLCVPDKGVLVGDSLVVDVIPFQSRHIKFHIAVKGIDVAFPGRKPTVRLAMDNMPHCFYFCKTTTDDFCCYHPALNELSGHLSVSRFCSMRFSDENNIVLKLTKDDDDLDFYHFSLVDFLEKEGIEVENRQEVTIPILIEFTEPFGDNIQGSVIVKRWDEIILIPDLDF